MNPKSKAEHYASSQYDVNQYTEPDSVKGTGWTDCRDAWLEGYNADRWIPVTPETKPEEGTKYLVFLQNTLDNRTEVTMSKILSIDNPYWKITHYQIIKTPTL